MIELEKTYDKIYRYCFMKIHNPQVAEDITQETFLRYFSVENIQKIDNLNAYLYSIARNLCTDYYRMQSVDSLDDMEVDTIESIEESDYEHSIMRISLEQAMESLPCDEKEILFLRYTNDISVNEIAKIIGISRFAVYRKEKNALKQLKKKLDRRDFL